MVINFLSTAEYRLSLAFSSLSFVIQIYIDIFLFSRIINGCNKEIRIGEPVNGHLFLNTQWLSSRNYRSSLVFVCKEMDMISYRNILAFCKDKSIMSIRFRNRSTDNFLLLKRFQHLTACYSYR